MSKFSKLVNRKQQTARKYDNKITKLFKKEFTEFRSVEYRHNTLHLRDGENLGFSITYKNNTIAIRKTQETRKSNYSRTEREKIKKRIEKVVRGV